MFHAMSAFIGVDTFLHGRFAIALLLLAALLGLWGTFSLATRRRVSPGFRSTFLLMAGLTGVQGLAGIIAFASGHRPRELLHIVYGIFAIAFLPGVFFFAARGSRSREAMLLAVSSWIVAIAYGRGIMTGY
jgi:4-amino-4-deoxy-L-arabinose transferase-like glycosyltransferase